MLIGNDEPYARIVITGDKKKIKIKIFNPTCWWISLYESSIVVEQTRDVEQMTIRQRSDVTSKLPDSIRTFSYTILDLIIINIMCIVYVYNAHCSYTVRVSKNVWKKTEPAIEENVRHDVLFWFFMTQLVHTHTQKIIIIKKRIDPKHNILAEISDCDNPLGGHNAGKTIPDVFWRGLSYINIYSALVTREHDCFAQSFNTLH